VGSRRVLLVLLILLSCAGVGLLVAQYAGNARNARSTSDADPTHAACKRDARPPSRRGLLNVNLGPSTNGKWKATFELKSDNAFGIDSFWYLESSDPPLKDDAGQRVFRVGDEPLTMETVEADMPVGSDKPVVMRLGKERRSYAYLTKEQQDAMDAGQPVAGRYPLAASSVVVLVNGDGVEGATHLTSLGNGQAVDLGAAPGTEVLAFAAGRVAFGNDGHDDQLRCGRTHANTYVNMVTILQDDGYEASYGHLKMGGILVQEGMRVERGQALARLGRYNGSASAAHLHFQLGGLTDSGLVSVPVAFEDEKKSVVIVPEKGQRIDPDSAKVSSFLKRLFLTGSILRGRRIPSDPVWTESGRWFSTGHQYGGGQCGNS